MTTLSLEKDSKWSYKDLHPSRKEKLYKIVNPDWEQREKYCSFHEKYQQCSSQKTNETSLTN